MDLLFGSLNLQGVKIMHSVQSGHWKYFVSLIPSSRKIKEVGKELALYADEIIPFRHFEMESREGIEFDNKHLFWCYFIRTHSWIQLGDKKTSLSLASDGAKAINNVQHCVTGLKVNDFSAKCPITGDRILPQTRNICWSLKFVMGQENEAMYQEHIKPLYRW